MSQALPFYSPTPRRLRRPNHPNLFLLGFSSKLILWFSSFFRNRSSGSQAERAVRQDQGRTRAGPGRKGRGCGGVSLGWGEGGVGGCGIRNRAVRKGQGRGQKRWRILAKSQSGPAWSRLEICSLEAPKPPF